MIIQVDSREHGNKEILDYFDLIKQKYVVSKMYTGDYCNLNNPTILIDIKKDVEEVIMNLTQDHVRFRNEVIRANNDMNCKLVVLIREPTIKKLDDIKNYNVKCFGKYYKDKELRGKPRSKMDMNVLYKIMKTMQEKYNLEWQFCSRFDCGKKIIEILERN